MAIHVVNYTKRSDFIKEIKGAKITRYDENGDPISDNDYRNPFLPKVGRNYKVRTKNGKKLVNLSQEKLDELVKDMKLYDPITNQAIEEAPMHNPAAPFWRHPKLNLWIDYSGISLDDENPLDYFWLKAMEADPRFRGFKDKINPAMSPIIDFTVSKLGSDITEQATRTDELYKAMKLLLNMDYDTRIKVLRAMGTDVRKGDPDVVERSLTVKITEHKDQLTSTGERQIEKFIRLAEESPAKLNIEGYANLAWKQRILSKKDSKYYYGDILVGRTLKDIQRFLEDEDNSDITSEIVSKIQKD